MNLCSLLEDRLKGQTWLCGY